MKQRRSQRRPLNQVKWFLETVQKCAEHSREALGEADFDTITRALQAIATRQTRATTADLAGG